MYEPSFPNVYYANRDEFIGLMKYGKVPDLMLSDILNLVQETDFFEAPASTKYHGAFPGGLYQHSRAVMDELDKWTRMGLIKWEREGSAMVVGFLHDFCKANKYGTVGWKEIPTSENPIPVYDYAKQGAGFGGHGEDSVCKILLSVPINREEAMCIRWHMGAYEKDKWNEFEAAIKEFPNVLWTHHADMVASKIGGV